MTKKITPKIIIQLLAALLIVTAVAFIHSANKCEQLQADLDQQSYNVANLNYDIEYANVRDTLNVAIFNALQSKYDELQKLHLADTKLIKDLKVRLKDVQSIHTASSTTADTVYLTPEPTAAVAGSGIPDSIYTYRDQWLSLHIDIPKRECQYSSRDSLTTIVSRTYRHKFLWWRWGTKGYQVQIVSHNPHSKIDYSRYIEVVK